MKKYLWVCLLIWTGSAKATVIDFESGLDPVFHYTGASALTSSLSINSGYDAVTTFTGSSGLAFNPNETSPTTFSWADSGSTFDLDSFVIAGAWGRQTLTIEGILNNTVVHSARLAVDNVLVDVFSAHWFGIDAFKITTGNDFALCNNVSGIGQQWALDNLIINEPSPVPVPSAAWLFSSGLISFIGMRKNRQK
jgi:hypothetical protein